MGILKRILPVGFISFVPAITAIAAPLSVPTLVTLQRDSGDKVVARGALIFASGPQARHIFLETTDPDGQPLSLLLDRRVASSLDKAAGTASGFRLTLVRTPFFHYRAPAEFRYRVERVSAVQEPSGDLYSADLFSSTPSYTASWLAPVANLLSRPGRSEYPAEVRIFGAASVGYRVAPSASIVVDRHPDGTKTVSLEFVTEEGARSLKLPYSAEFDLPLFEGRNPVISVKATVEYHYRSPVSHSYSLAREQTENSLPSLGAASCPQILAQD